MHPGADSLAGGQLRVKPLTLLVGLALAQLAATSVRADSGSGVDTSAANALNPAGLSSARDKDPDGLGEASHSRSPTGFMYPAPWAVRAPNKTDSGWLLNSSIELGGLMVRGDREASKFREYKDLKSGLYVNNLSLQAEKPADAYFVDLYGGGLGRDDQFFSLTAGRYNDWKVKAFYNETPHVFTSTYRNLWSGAGTDHLWLNSGLPTAPSAAPDTTVTTSTAIRNTVLATPYSTLSLVRKKGGVRLDLTLPDSWKFYAGYTNEHRVGERPFGLVFGGGGSNGSLEIPESIDYNTHDFLTGVQWGNALTSVNFQVSASLFRNHVDTETVESPLFEAAANGITRFPYGQFDQYPDNDAYTIKAEVAHAIPEWARARFTGVFLATSTQQNDALIPSSPNGPAVINSGTTPVAGGAWDSTASLSKKNAGARIDSKLLDLGVALTPVEGFDLRGKLRHYETSNDTEYWACNPLTGQWGRLINNGTAAVTASPNLTAGNNPLGTLGTAYDGARCNIDAVKALNLVPANGNTTIRNTPYEYKQDNYSLSADFRIANSQNVTASIEREDFDRKHRERDRTWEDKVKVGYVNRAMAGGTIRASLEGDRRRGSTYVSDPYEEFYSASFGPKPTANTTNVTSWIHTNDLHRKFDLADRDIGILNLRFNHAIGEELDLGLALQIKDTKYPTSEYGRKGHWRQNSFNADLNWQPSPELNVYGYLTHQLGHITQAGLNQNACTIGTTYAFYSDGSVSNTNAPLSAAQIAAGISVVGRSTVDATNWEALCAGAAALSPLYPTSRTWTVTADDTNTTAGFGAKWDFVKAKLDLNYAYSYGRTRFRYSYNPYALGTAALVSGVAPTAAQQLVLGLIGSGLPDQVIQTDTIDAGLLVPVNKSAAVRLLLRHEIGKYRDPHYNGVAANPVPLNNYVYLDTGPQDYHVTTLGVLLQLTW
jgi:hypothetical protein